MSESKTSKRNLEALDRQVAALELRKQGVSFIAIAKKLGYSGPAGAYRAVMTAIQKTLQEPADELRKIELERLDVMQAAAWWAASNGEPHAIDRVLRIMERRAKYMGLDAPTQYEHILREEAERISAYTGKSADALLAEAKAMIAEKG